MAFTATSNQVTPVAAVVPTLNAAVLSNNVVRLTWANVPSGTNLTLQWRDVSAGGSFSAPVSLGSGSAGPTMDITGGSNSWGIPAFLAGHLYEFQING
jgi:hypothetical protein